ncbi:hypothetical protein GQR58_030504 [Nymphon striatum]|nr:hypothetical protein GQR58_030504 [Nymphon striatum]
MEALHDVVKSGKVRYIGASSMWAWQFAKALFVGRAEWLDPVCQHAESLQPAQPRRRARDVAAVRRSRHCGHSVEPHGTRSSHPRLGRNNLLVPRPTSLVATSTTPPSRIVSSWTELARLPKPGAYLGLRWHWPGSGTVPRRGRTEAGTRGRRAGLSARALIGVDVRRRRRVAVQPCRLVAARSRRSRRSKRPGPYLPARVATIDVRACGQGLEYTPPCRRRTRRAGRATAPHRDRADSRWGCTRRHR